MSKAFFLLEERKQTLSSRPETQERDKRYECVNDLIDWIRGCDVLSVCDLVRKKRRGSDEHKDEIKEK